MPVIAPEEPQLALARGAALASANAPRYDTSTVGLAYSQDPDGTTVYPLALADDATTFLGHADASPDTADIASDPDDVPERSKPFLLVGSSLTAIFVAGVMALAIAMVINIQPTADRGSGEMTVHPERCWRRLPRCRVRRPPRRSRCPRRSLPPLRRHHHLRATATARLMVPPAPPPRVVVRNAAPAPAAPPPAPAAPPPVVLPPGIPPPRHPVAPTDSSATPLLQPAVQSPPWHRGGRAAGEAAAMEARAATTTRMETVIRAVRGVPAA